MKFWCHNRPFSVGGKKLIGFLLALMVVAPVARAQFTYSEDFKNSTAPGWVLNPAGNSTPNTTLTSGATPRSGDPEIGNSTIDPSGSGWLRLTNNTLNTHNAVYFDTPIPSAGNSVTIQFGMNQFGGNQFNGTGADGITFFLYDASKTFQVGADGGSIGYAQKTGVNGLNGGFVAVALDAYGNFSVNGEGRVGGTASLQPNSVVVRGPGQGQTGYDYLAGTGNKDYTDTGSPTVNDGTDGSVPALPYTMAFPTATARPNQSTQYRNVSITINENSQLSVSMQFGEDGLWYQLLNVDLSSFVRPEQLKMGFSAGTGSGTSVTEVGGLLTIQATAGTGNFIWDNRNGPSDSGSGNSVWGTGATDPLNWAGQTNPTLKSNVIFNSTYISSTQNIDVNGSDKVVTNLYFSGANSYNLTTSEARKLIFDANTSGLTAINLTNDFSGNAAHTIGLDIQMNDNLDINNNITPTFTITGNIDTGGNVLGLKGIGTTVLAGVISGTGSLVKSDSGTTRLTGSSANTYTGNTTINAGTLQIEKAGALGSTAAGTTVASGGTLALAGAGTTFAAEGLTLNGTGVSNAGALRNVAGVNAWTGTVALGGAGNNNIGVDAGSLTISGVISGAAGSDLNKVGTGVLTLSGTNTYSGNTSISAGTIAISADSNLGAAPGAAATGKFNLDGGTLQTTATMTLNANRGVTLGTGGGTFQTDAGTTLTYNGIAAGSGSLTKTGAGTMIVGGANTYSGATTINQGTFQLGANNVLSDSTAVTVASGATFNVNARTETIGSLGGAGAVTLGANGALTTGAANTASTFSGSMTGTGTSSLVKTGTGTMVLSGTAGANAIAPNTISINGGTLQLGASNVIGNSTSLVFNGGTFSVNGNNETVGSAQLLSSSTLDYNSLAGILNLGNGTYTGGTLTINNWAGSTAGGGASQLILPGTITGAMLANINFAGYGTGAQLIGTEIVPAVGTGSTWNVNADGNWNTGSNWSPVGVPNGIGAVATFGNAITTAHVVTQNLAGATVGYMNFNNANSYTINGANRLTMDVSAGSAQINLSGGGAHSINTGLTLNDNLIINQNSSGTFTLGATNSITGTDKNVTVSGSGNTTISGTITTGNGTLTKNNEGVLTLGGANTFLGAINVNGGVLSISSEANLGNTTSTAPITLNGGTLRTTGADFTVATSTRDIVLGANGGTIDTVNNLTWDNGISGSGSLTKTGTGNLTFLDPSTFTGAFNINAGNVIFDGGNDRLADVVAVSIASGATLNVNTRSDTIGSLAGAGTLTNGGATAATITFGGINTDTTFSGTITNGTGALNLVKTGTGRTILSGNNSYTGTTAINAGILNIQSNTALGTGAGGTTVAGNAALELQNNITVASEVITLNGLGFAGANGALRNISGNNTITPAIALGSATAVQSDAGLLTLTGGLTGTDQNLTLAGAGNITVSGAIATGNGTLTKNGSGYVTLGGNNTFNGATTINAGTLEIQKNDGLGTTMGSTTVATGATLALSGNITVPEGLSVAGQGVNSLGSIHNLSGANTLTGAIALGASTYIGVDGASTLTTTGVLSGANDLTKVGTGTLVLNGAANNTYTGTTAVNAGTLEIRQSGQLGGGTGVTTVSSGATLRVTGSGLTIGENVTLSGSGVSNLGALQNSGGNNTWSGGLTMNADTAIGAASGTTLTSTGTIANAINNSYNLTKVDAGTLVLSGVNTYSGATTVRNGTLSVNASAPVSTNGALGNSGSTVQVGDSGTAAADHLGLIIGPAGNITLDRAISINNFNTSGTVTMGGSNTAGTNSFTGNIGLGRDVNVTSAAGGNVAFTGAISGGGGVTVNGTGTVVFSGNNTYTGATTINSGATLVAASANALGATSGAVTLNSGSTLGVQGGITIPSAQSISSAGTFSNLSGNNTIASPISLTGATTFNTVAGDLTVSGAVSGAQNVSTSTTAGSKVIFTGNSTYSGTTTVSGGGTLVLANTGGVALGNTTSVTINSGATLQLGASNQINNAANLVLAGGTFALNGNSEGSTTTPGLNNLSLSSAGTLDFTGNSASLRFASDTAGGTLTISGWAGDPLNGGGSHQLLINTNSTNIGLGNITFTDWGSARIIATSTPGIYEILPTVSLTSIYQWDGSGNTSWNTGTNWTRGDGSAGANNQPNTTGMIVTFGDLGQGRLTADLGGTARTLGRLYFENTDATANNYTLQNGTITLDVTGTGGTAEIVTSNDVAPTINTSLTASDNVRITNNSTGTLNLSSTGGTFNMNGNDLTVTGSGTTTVAKVISGTGTDLTKSGSGLLVLSGVNTFTGNTTVSNGTLRLDVSAPSGASGALGNATTAVLLNDSTTTAAMNTALLTGTTAGTSVGRDITVGNFGNATTIGGLNTTGTNTYSGNISLGKTTNLSAEAGGEVAFTGALSGTGGLNKVGNGTVTLGGTSSNTFTGHVDIQAGTLKLDKSGAGVDAIGSVQGAIGDLAAVSLSGSSSVLNIAASGVYTLEEIGSLSGVSGSNVNVSTASAFTLYTGNNSQTTTMAGTITNSGGGPLSLVKQGTGNMTLSGANSYTGNTTVSAGMLVAANNTALGTTAAGTAVAGNATLGLSGGITVTGEALSLTAITSPNIPSLANLDGANTWTGNIVMTGSTANDAVKYDAAGGSQLTISGVVSEGTNAKVFAKTGAGTVILSGNNTYTGSTNVIAGTLIVANNGALGTTAAGTAVQIGATLGVQGNVTVAAGETYTLNGTTNPPAAPSLKNISGTNTLQGNIALSGGINTGVALDSNAGSLVLNGAITQTTNPNFIIKTGSGDLQLGGTTANTFSGGFLINDGAVIAAKTAGITATGNGSINIGDGIGASNSAILRLNTSNQIADISNVTIATDGKLDLQGNSDSIAALTMGGGSVTSSGNGTLTLGGNLTFNGVGSAQATITANLDLGTTGSRVVQIGNNGSNADIDLSINGVISGTGASFNKTDLGVLELTGSTANTFTGGFQVSDGTVVLNKSGNLNSTTGTGNAVTVGDSINAADTAILKLGQSHQIKDTATVTVNSDGQFNVNGLTETIGAIAGSGHIETGAGTLTIAGNASVSTFSGRLTDSTGAFDVNGNVTTLGSGRVVLDMDQDHTGTKTTPSGSLTFNSNINFAGTLELKSGTLFLPGVVLNLGALEITGQTILDFGNSAASILNTGSIKLAPGATLTITNWVNNVDFFFAQTWLAGTTVPGINTRGVGDETQITFDGYTPSQTAWLDYNNGAKHEITPAPEPSTYGAIFTGAALALLGYRRWRKARTAATQTT